jgi:hypothetical protein
VLCVLFLFVGIRVACHFSFLCCVFCFCLLGSVLLIILVFCVVCFVFVCGGFVLLIILVFCVVCFVFVSNKYKTHNTEN